MIQKFVRLYARLAERHPIKVASISTGCLIFNERLILLINCLMFSILMVKSALFIMILFYIM